MIEGFYLVLLGLGSAGLGRLILRGLGFIIDDLLERLCFAVALGLGLFMLAMIGLGATHLLYAPCIAGAVALGWGVGGWDLVRRPPRALMSLTLPAGLVRRLEVWLLAALVLSQGLGFLRALAPPHGSTDPLAYQLALPKLFLTTHGLGFEATVTGALYPSNMGMLYLAAIALRGGNLAQVVHWFMGAMTCVAVVGFARRYLTTQAGVWAAVIFGSVPVVVVFGPQGYIDLGLCYFQFVAFWALVNHLARRRDGPWLVLAAVVTGIAMGIKHQGLATLAVGVLALVADAACRREGRQGARNLALFAGLALTAAAPWYLRSMAFTGNPIWPLASGVFGESGFAAAPTILSGAVGPDQGLLWGLVPPLEWWSQYASAMTLWQWTFEPSTWQKAIGPYFVALLPGVVLLGRRRSAWLLLGGCLVYHAVLIRVLHMNPRYGLVLFAYLSLLCGLVAEYYWRHRYAAVRVVFALAMAASMVLNVSWSYFQTREVMGVVSGRQSETGFLLQREPGFRVLQEANRILPAEAVVLLQGIVKGYYCDRRYLWDHPHQGIVDYDGNPTPEKLLQHLGDLGVTHIVRMIHIPPGRLALGYPQYFESEYHESFRRKYLKLLYRDEVYAMFKVAYPSTD